MYNIGGCNGERDSRPGNPRVWAHIENQGRGEPFLMKNHSFVALTLALILAASIPGGGEEIIAAKCHVLTEFNSYRFVP